ncbi:MAG: hypothetical protein QOE01_115 [Actinomycetota bacterium]|nr:hypothetical protein [Actinomycetota bacterium]
MTSRPHTTTNVDGPGRSLTSGLETGPCPMIDSTSESIGRREHASIRAAGFWAAVLALVGAIGYILSVPLQIMSMLSPTQDSVLAFVSSLAIAPSFLVAVVALHYTVLPEKRFWTHVAVQLASIYATLACINYVVQLATVLPAGYTWSFTDQAGTLGPLSVLNQTPHSLMWDLDGLAYIFLNLSTLFAARAFGRQGPERVIRRVFLANASITPLFAMAYFWPHFSVPMLLLGGIPWSITVPASMLALSMYFRRPLSDDAKHTVARSSMSGAGYTAEVSAERPNAA